MHFFLNLKLSLSFFKFIKEILLCLFIVDGPEYVTFSPSTTTYTVTEGDTIPAISCNASCRPQCTFMWTEPNVPDGTTNDLYLQNITRNQKGTLNCTATNEVGSKVSSNVVVDVQCKLLQYYCRLPIHVTLITQHATRDKKNTG